MKLFFSLFILQTLFNYIFLLKIKSRQKLNINDISLEKKYGQNNNDYNDIHNKDDSNENNIDFPFRDPSYIKIYPNDFQNIPYFTQTSLSQQSVCAYKKNNKEKCSSSTECKSNSCKNEVCVNKMKSRGSSCKCNEECATHKCMKGHKYKDMHYRCQ